MKISQAPDNYVASNGKAAASLSKPAAASAVQVKAAAALPSAQSAGVALTVSSLARSLKLDQSLSEVDVDSSKVKSIKSAIADGTFVIHAGVIADKLLANAQEILVRARV